MSQLVTESANFKNITGTATVRTGAAALMGIFVSSSTAGTIKVQDGSATIVNTFNAVAGTYYPIPAVCGTSIVVTVTGTLDACVFWASLT